MCKLCWATHHYWELVPACFINHSCMYMEGAKEEQVEGERGEDAIQDVDVMGATSTDMDDIEDAEEGLGGEGWEGETDSIEDD